MFEAYATEKVISFEATCIAPFNKQNKLFVGSKSGHLVYCSRRADGKRCFEYQVSRAFEKRSILELKVVESHDLILCLTSDSQLTVHSAAEPFALVDTISKYRPVTAFGYHVLKDENKLIVAISVKKRVHIFKWIVDSFEEQEPSNLCLPDNARVLSWCNKSAILFSARNEYFYMKVFKDVGDTAEEVEEVGKARSLISTGSRAPEISPLILEMPEKGWFALRSDNLVVFVNDEGKYAKCECSFSDLPLALAYDSPYLVAVLAKGIVEIRTIQPPLLIQKIVLGGAFTVCSGKTGCVYVGGDRSSWVLCSEPLIRENVKFLTEDKQFELAVILAKQHPDLVDTTSLTETYRRRAYALFAEKKFSDCFNSHLEIKTDVLLVMNFLPFLIPEKYLDSLSKYSSIELSFFESNVSSWAENERRQAIFALGDYLSAKRTEYAQKLSLHYKDFRDNRKQNLLPTKILKKYEAILELVDTVLLKCYIRTKPTLVSSLLRLPDNSCIISEAEDDLKKERKYPELLILYERKRLHRKALNLLKNEAKNEESVLCGVERFAEYLHNLVPVDLKLVFEFAPFVLAENVDLGIQIFTGCPDSSELIVPKLDHEEVLQFLKKHCEDGIIPYLEHIIFRLHEQRPKFHDLLADCYVTRVKLLMKDYVHMLTDDQLVTRGGEEEGDLGILRRKLMHFLEFSQVYSAEEFISKLDDYLLEEKAILYGRLKEHDKVFAIYANILMNFEAAERHCSLYYDPKDAINSQVYFQLFKAYASPMDLSKLDFKPKFAQPSRPNISEALKILRKHAAKIDTERAIMLIPMDTPLQKVWVALEAVFEAIKNKATSANLLSSINQLALKRYEARLRHIRSQRILIDNNVECIICRKKIANSAFVRLRDKSIAHFFCFKNTPKNELSKK